MAFIHLYYLTKIDFPVVVSESVSNMLLEKNNFKIGFVRNGIDTERFKALDKDVGVEDELAALKSRLRR